MHIYIRVLYYYKLKFKKVFIVEKLKLQKVSKNNQKLTITKAFVLNCRMLCLSVCNFNEFCQALVPRVKIAILWPVEEPEISLHPGTFLKKGMERRFIDEAIKESLIQIVNIHYTSVIFQKVEKLVIIFTSVSQWIVLFSLLVVRAPSCCQMAVRCCKRNVRCL